MYVIWCRSLCRNLVSQKFSLICMPAWTGLPQHSLSRILWLSLLSPLQFVGQSCRFFSFFACVRFFTHRHTHTLTRHPGKMGKEGKRGRDGNVIVTVGGTVSHAYPQLSCQMQCNLLHFPFPHYSGCSNMWVLWDILTKNLNLKHILNSD